MAAAPHDLAALYLRHRDAMFAVAYSVLRGTARVSDVEDVVMATVASLLDKPPTEPLINWEAYLVRASRNKALDLLRSAAVRHAGAPIEQDPDSATDEFIADGVAERVDDSRDGAVLWDKLALLEPRERRILWEYKGKGRPRSGVARVFGISPARVSQISTQTLRTLCDEIVKEGLQR